MADETWKEVRSKLEGLGLKLKLHLEQEADESDETATPGETRKAVEDLGNRLFDLRLVGPSVHDERVCVQILDQVVGLLRNDRLQDDVTGVLGLHAWPPSSAASLGAAASSDSTGSSETSDVRSETED